MHASVKAMAMFYIEEMRKVQPHGPYFLGGYSFGGFVAFEMAQQLTAAGEKVALPVLFDTDRQERPSSLVARFAFRFKVPENLPLRKLGRHFLRSCFVIGKGAVKEGVTGVRNRLRRFTRDKGAPQGTEPSSAQRVQLANERALAGYKLGV